MSPFAVQMNNQYFAFRHGESRANVEGIVISDPAVGTTRYGLTAEGRRQVLAGIEAAEGFDSETLIVSSDFKRAAQTAEMIRETLDVETVQFDARLRERFFGNYEGAPHASYSEAWKNDALASSQERSGVENADAVRRRMWAVIESLEAEYAGRKIILVSHGDPLLILQSAFEGIAAADHRSLPYFNTAELRMLK
jgi:probable phosphoglycerate mutase